MLGMLRMPGTAGMRDRSSPLSPWRAGTGAPAALMIQCIVLVSEITSVNCSPKWVSYLADPRRRRLSPTSASRRRGGTW